MLKLRLKRPLCKIAQGVSLFCVKRQKCETEKITAKIGDFRLSYENEKCYNVKATFLISKRNRKKKMEEYRNVYPKRENRS